ncbi:MAG: DsbA family oxidoreductase [Rhodospirillaceae bacterium]|nr:DsbA family oxidoreductase [Rhodospirillaceae bacterium]
MHIDIYSDPVCPWCLIGKRRLEKALETRPVDGLTVKWRPFQLHPHMPAEGADRAEFTAAKFGSAERAAETYERVKVVGADEGLDFRFDKIKRSPNTVDAHRLLHYADKHDKQDAVSEGLFADFFFDGHDVSDLDVLVDTATEAGLDADAVRAYLESDEDRELIQNADEEARALGIQGVPFFVINQKYALSGAQPPEMFVKALADIEAEEMAGADA